MLIYVGMSDQLLVPPIVSTTFQRCFLRITDRFVSATGLSHMYTRVAIMLFVLTKRNV